MTSTDKNTLLNPEQWNLLHQEGHALLEQINRKLIQPYINNKLLPPPSPIAEQRLAALRLYAERSVGRLTSYIQDLHKSFEIFSKQTKYTRKAIVSGKFLPPTSGGNIGSKTTRLYDRGVLNLELSPTDLLSICEGLQMLFYNELQYKADVVTLYLMMCQNILQYLLKVNPTQLHPQYNQSQDVLDIFDESLQFGTTTNSDSTAQHLTQIDSIDALIEKYPWLSVFKVQTLPVCNGNDEKATTKKGLVFDMTNYVLQSVDYIGILQFFEQRPGYNHTNYTRLSGLIKASPLAVHMTSFPSLE
eukprot:UN00414